MQLLLNPCSCDAKFPLKGYENTLLYSLSILSAEILLINQSSQL